jgi:hypothetical protein
MTGSVQIKMDGTWGYLIKMKITILYIYNMYIDIYIYYITGGCSSLLWDSHTLVPVDQLDDPKKCICMYFWGK